MYIVKRLIVLCILVSVNKIIFMSIFVTCYQITTAVTCGFIFYILLNVSAFLTEISILLDTFKLFKRHPQFFLFFKNFSLVISSLHLTFEFIRRRVTHAIKPSIIFSFCVIGFLAKTTVICQASCSTFKCFSSAFIRRNFALIFLCLGKQLRTVIKTCNSLVKVLNACIPRIILKIIIRIRVRRILSHQCLNIPIGKSLKLLGKLIVLNSLVEGISILIIAV